MNKLLERIHAIGAHAWVKFLSRLNSLLLLACLGVVMISQTNPGIVAAVTASLSPTQQALVSFAFCCMVQYALRRVKKADGAPPAPPPPGMPL